jgi:hypothetical protein
MIVNGMILIDPQTNQPAQIGSTVVCFRGESFKLLGGAPPRHAGSTGRIYVRHLANRQSDNGYEKEYETEFYPSVCSLKWAKVGEEK